MRGTAFPSEGVSERSEAPRGKGIFPLEVSRLCWGLGKEIDKMGH